ncbi:MAG: universal stress protein [Gemmatimonadota bacterium]
MTSDSTPFRAILVPLDGSTLAEQALPLACQFAERTGGKIRLVLVHEMSAPPVNFSSSGEFTSLELATRKFERGYLREIKARLRASGTRVSSAVTLTGAVGPAIAQYASEMAVELVVMATHGRGGVRRVWMGSVADDLISHLECSLLLLRPGEDGSVQPYTFTGGEILVPLDGSPLAEQALPSAGALARAWDAPLSLLQVVRPVMMTDEYALPFPARYDDEVTEVCRLEAQRYLDLQVASLEAQKLRAHGHAILSWNVVTALLDRATPERVSFIVIATHGRTGLERLALGSVADKLVRGAEVPVLVFRPGLGKLKPRAQRIAKARA